MDSYSSLSGALKTWNGKMGVGFKVLDSIWATSHGQVQTPSAEIVFDKSLGVYRFRDKETKLFLVNSSGYYLYYKPDDSGVSGGDTPAQEGGNWIQQINADLDKVHLVSMDTLQASGAFSGLIANL